MIERLMDAAARADRHRQDRAAPPQHDPPRADALQEPDGQDLRQRPFRACHGSGARTRRLEGLRRPRGGFEARGKLRGQGIATFIEWTGVDIFTEVVDVTVTGDGTDRDLHRGAADGTEPRDDVHAARRRRLRRGRRSDQRALRRHRSRRPASGAPARARCSSSDRRCASQPSARWRKRTTSPRGARSGGGRHRIPRRRLQHRGHRPAHRSVRARVAAGRPAHRAQLARAPSTRRAGPTAATSAKSKSIPIPAPCSSTATGRSTTSGASSIRWS